MKLHEPDILYVEAFLHYISIHTAKREYRIKESISSFEKRLTDDFFRIHRSYLVSPSPGFPARKSPWREGRSCRWPGENTMQ